MNDFEKKVRKTLIDKDMTLSQLAKELKISVSYLYDILNSTRKADKQREKIISYLNLQEPRWEKVENKKTKKIKLSIDMDDLDKAQEKANKLKDTLLEVKQLISSLNSSKN